LLPSNHIANRPGNRRPGKDTEPDSVSGTRLPLPVIANPLNATAVKAHGVESFWTVAGGGLSLVSLVHDARNMLSALHLYCDLLEEPGVLAARHAHYAGELQMVASAASRLVEQMTWIAGSPTSFGNRANAPHAEVQRFGAVGGEGTQPMEQTAAQSAVALSAQPADLLEPEYLPLPEQTTMATETPCSGATSIPGSQGSRVPDAAPVSVWREEPLHRQRAEFESKLVDDLGQAVRSLRPLLSALAGPSVELEVDCMPCEGRIRMTPEDLTRILVNLVSNAAEAMTHKGTVRITVQKGGGASFMPAQKAAQTARTAVLAVQDTGVGIPSEIREHVFEPGFTTRMGFSAWPANAHRGLGLSIAHDLVGLAGGEMRLVSAPGRGARFEMELPLLESLSGDLSDITDSRKGRRIQC
jgi:hypothetical protein